MSIDKKINRNDLKEAAGIHAVFPAKLDKGANIRTDVLHKICEAMDLLCENIVQITNGEAIINLIEECFPDMVPAYALNVSEEELRNFGINLE